MEIRGQDNEWFIIWPFDNGFLCLVGWWQCLYSFQHLGGREAKDLYIESTGGAVAVTNMNAQTYSHIIVAFWSSRLSPSTTRHKGSNPKPALPPTPLGSGWWTGAWSSSWWVQKSGDSLTLSLTSWACEMAHFLCFLILLFAFPVLALKRDTILLFLLFFMTLFGFCDPTNALNSRKVYRHRTTMKLFWYTHSQLEEFVNPQIVQTTCKNLCIPLID